MNYRLGIVGSRHYNNYSEFGQVINQIISVHGKPHKIVSGGHTNKSGYIKPGTDTLAWKWSLDNNIPITEYNAEWSKYGRGAGPIRNRLIVDDIDVLIAFVASDSVGTKNTISLAQNNPEIKIYIYNIPN